MNLAAKQKNVGKHGEAPLIPRTIVGPSGEVHTRARVASLPPRPTEPAIKRFQCDTKRADGHNLDPDQMSPRAREVLRREPPLRCGQVDT